MKNRVCVLQQPTKICCTVIYFREDYEFPISQVALHVLDSLSATSDLFFVLPKSLEEKINFMKFSSVSGAIAYMKQEKDEVNSIIDALSYAKDLMGQYIGFAIMNASSLDVEGLDWKAIPRLSSSVFSRSIFSYRRLVASELASIYMVPEKKSLKSYIYNLLNGAFFTHTTEDDILFLRPSLVKKLVDIRKRKEIYVNTFETLSIKNFLPSFLERYGEKEDILKLNVKDAKA